MASAIASDECRDGRQAVLCTVKQVLDVGDQEGADLGDVLAKSRPLRRLPLLTTDRQKRVAFTRAPEGR